jgi:hypothetical protein
LTMMHPPTGIETPSDEALQGSVYVLRVLPSLDPPVPRTPPPPFPPLPVFGMPTLPLHPPSHIATIAVRTFTSRSNHGSGVQATVPPPRLLALKNEPVKAGRSSADAALFAVEAGDAFPVAVNASARRPRPHTVARTMCTGRTGSRL